MNLQQLLIIFWARKRLFVAYLLVTMISTLVLSLLMSKQYVADTSLVLNQPDVNPITGERLPTQLVTGYTATQSDIIKSPAVALVVVDMLNLLENQNLQAAFKKDKAGGDFRHWLAGGLIKNLEVIPSRESSILGISFSAPDPDFAAQVANAYAQAYIQTVNELKHQHTQQIADWFDGQLSVLRERMEKSREKLSNFQQTHGIIASATNEQIDLEDAKLTELSNQLIKNQLETSDRLSKKKQLAENLANPESLNSLDEVLNNKLLQDLKADLARSEAKFADLSIRLDKNHPQYRQAAAEIANLKKQIKNETNTILHGFNTSVSSSKQRDTNLIKTLEQQKNKVLRLKKQQDEIAILKREVENAQLVYDAAMQRSIQMRMESDIRQSNIAILDLAIPSSIPAKPKVLLNMVLSVLLGSIVGLAAALFAEMMDRRVRSSIDITENLDLPVFGVITTSRSAKKSGVLT